MSKEYTFEGLDEYTYDDLDAPEVTPDTAPAEPGKLESLGRGVQQGATFGFGDEFSGGVDAALHVGSKLFGGESPYKDIKEAYRTGRDANRAENKAAEEARGGMYLAGQIGGGALTAAAPGLGALNAAKGAPLKELIKAGAIGGGVAGLGGSESETLGGNAVDTAKGAGLGVLGMWGGQKLGQSLDKAAKTAAAGTAKILLTASKPVDKYLADPKKYNVDETAETVAEKVLPYFRGKEDEAAQALNHANKRAAGATLKQATADSKAQFADNARKYVLNKMKMSQPSAEAVDALESGLQSQGAKTAKLAAQQRDLLRNSDAQIDLSGVDESVQKRLQGRSVEGLLPPDAEVRDIEGIAGFLNKLKNRNAEPGAEYTDDLLGELQQEGLTVSPESALNLRQYLQNVARPSFDATGIPHVPAGAKAAREAAANVNKALDSAGEQLAGYRPLRQQIANEMKLNTTVDDLLAGPDRAKTLAKAAAPGRELQALKQLDGRNNKDILPALAPYLSDKGKLANPERLAKYLDTSREAQQAAKATKEAVREKIMAQLAKAKADKAQQATKVGDLTSKNIDKKIREASLAYEFNPKMQLGRDMAELETKSGVPLKDLIDVVGVRSAFGKEGAQGSRLVNWLSRLGGGKVPEGMLATAGAGLDVGRGRAAKGVLDGYLATQPYLQGAGKVFGESIKRGTPAMTMDAQADQDGDAQYQKLLELLKDK